MPTVSVDINLKVETQEQINDVITELKTNIISGLGYSSVVEYLPGM